MNEPLCLQLEEAIGRAQGAALDAVTRALWAAHAAGQCTDDDATRLDAAIQARRKLEQATRGGGGGHGTLEAALTRRRPQRPPVRSVAIERRRRWAAAGRLPPKLAALFTLGEQAALAVIAVEAGKRGTCTLAIGAIAALAGVSINTVKRALRQARALGLVTIEERRLSRFRNDTNVVRVVSREWLSWLRLGPKGGGGQFWPGTNTKVENNGHQQPLEAPQRAAGGQGRSRAPASQNSGAGPLRRAGAMS